MKNYFYVLALLTLICSCGAKSDTSYDINKASDSRESMVNASQKVDLENKGVGPIKEVGLGGAIDEDLARTGEGLYKKHCTICHKTDAVFIGPPPKDILQRRSPEWVMNMILAPGRMLRDDPLAKELFLEFNGSPMANQGLNQDEARAILEFFRTL